MYTPFSFTACSIRPRFLLLLHLILSCVYLFAQLQTSLVSSRSFTAHSYVQYQAFQPLDVAVDSKGFLYAADANSRSVIQLSPTGKEIRRFPTNDTSWTVFDAAAAVSPNGAIIYTTSSNRQESRILKVASTGELLLTITTSNPSLGSLDSLTLDTAGALYAADSINARVVKFSPDGVVLAIFQANVSGISILPSTVVIDALGNAVVLDVNHRWLISFAQNGTVVMSVDLRKLNGYLTSVAMNSAQQLLVTFYTSSEAPACQMATFTHDGRLQSISKLIPETDFPSSLKVDLNGNMYIAAHHAVVKLNVSGYQLASYNLSAPPFELPIRIAVDSTGVVYVSDINPSRVLQMSHNGKSIRSLISNNSTQLQYIGVTVDHSDAVYTSVPNGHEIYKLSHTGDVLAVYNRSGFKNMWLPDSVRVDALGALYFIDSSYLLYKLWSNGTQILLYSNATDGSLGDVAIDLSGFLFVTLGRGRAVVKLTSEGAVVAMYPIADLPVAYPLGIVLDRWGGDVGRRYW